jgi:hypothetical protein
MSSVKDAAAEIVALINASPRSPRVEEIEAIIARCGTPGTSPGGLDLTPCAAEFLRTDEGLRMVIAETDISPPTSVPASDYEKAMARQEAAHNELAAVAERIWAQPGDVLACAYVANAYCGYPWDLAANRRRYPLPDPDDEENANDGRATEELIVRVLELATREGAHHG